MASNKFSDLRKSHLWEMVDSHLSDYTRLLLYFTNKTQVFRSLTPDEEKLLEEEDEEEYECDDGYDRWDEEYNDDKDYDWYHIEKYECNDGYDRWDEEYNDDLVDYD